MHRTTIMLPEDLKLRAERLARRRGVSLGEVVRQSLLSHLDRQADEVREDPLLADTAAYPGPSEADAAAAHDRYLYGDEE